MAAIVFVFLLLAALYESWRLPWAVLLGSPLVALGAFFGVWLLGYDNNVYVQIGNIMLIGLAAKNAILIVEFAKAKHDKEGMPFQEAALESARLRFRPILMTAFAFILGVVPLMRASGAGAGAQNVMGTAVFFGMLVATALGVFLIPGNYAFVEGLGRKKKRDAEPDGRGGAIGRGGALSMRRRWILALALCPLASPAPWAGLRAAAAGHSRAVAADRPRRRHRSPTFRGGSCSRTSSCETLITTALEENRDLRIAVERIEEARALYGFSRSQLYPQLDADAHAGALRLQRRRPRAHAGDRRDGDDEDDDPRRSTRWE